MKEVPVHVCAYILVFVFQRNPYGTIFELPPKIVGLHNAICIFMICKFWQLRIRDQKICTTIWARIWVGKVLYRHRKRKCIFPTTGCCLFFFSRQNLFFFFLSLFFSCCSVKWQLYHWVLCQSRGHWWLWETLCTTSKIPCVTANWVQQCHQRGRAPCKSQIWLNRCHSEIFP